MAGVIPLAELSLATLELLSRVPRHPAATDFRRGLQLEVPVEKHFGLVEFALTLNICGCPGV